MSNNIFEETQYNSKFDVSLWKKIFVYIKGFKKETTIIIFALIVIAVLEASIPLFTKYAIETFIEKEDISNLYVFIGIYALVTLLGTCATYNYVKYTAFLETGLVYEIRKTAFRKLQELSFSYYDTNSTGWIMARMTSDAQKIGDVIAWSALDLIWGFSAVGVGFIFMFSMNVELTLLVLLVVPILALISWFFQNKIFKSQRQVRRFNSKITGAFNEGINGARTTKTLLRERQNFEDFQELSYSMKSFSIRSAMFSSLFLPCVLFISSIALSFVLNKGGYKVMDGVITFGVFSAFVSYAIQMFDPIQQIARIFSDLQSAQASAERTLAIIETEPDIKDYPEVIEKYGDFLNPKLENWEKIEGNVKFENVSFSYKTGENVLEDFNLTINAGEKIALVGETGSGKSTIINLVCRFYEPTKGRILIDGVDYRERAQIWLQSNLGYVLQTPHLFSGTIMENIRYSKLDATDEEVISSAKIVNAYNFIMNLENGFETNVGEGGNRLSSGEKQLISFARAILSNPRIFILDEATSSIDTETEKVIQEAIDVVLKGRTSFIVAHRLSTIRMCDRILVISKGKIIESGTHKELIQNKGHYYRLYTNQFKKEEENKILSRG